MSVQQRLVNVRHAAGEVPVVFVDALKYPLSPRFRTVETLLLGGLLSFYDFYLLPAVLVVGYLLRILERPGGESPSFERWLSLAWDGLRGFGISFVYYGIVPVTFTILLGREIVQPGEVTRGILIFLPGAGLIEGVGLLGLWVSRAVPELQPFVAGIPTEPIAQSLIEWLSDPNTTDALLLVLVLTYLTPAALLAFARSSPRSFFAGLDPRAVWRVLGGHYTVGWVVYLGIWLLGRAIVLRADRFDYSQFGFWATEIAFNVVVAAFVLQFYCFVAAFSALARWEPNETESSERRSNTEPTQEAGS